MSFVLVEMSFQKEFNAQSKEETKELAARRVGSDLSRACRKHGSFQFLSHRFYCYLLVHGMVKCK